MTIRYAKIPLAGEASTQNNDMNSQGNSRADSPLALYLREAECAVDGMTDAELNLAELKLRSQITALIHPPFRSHTADPLQLRSPYPKRDHANRKSYFVMGFCLAAAVSLLIRSEDDAVQNRWQIKGHIQPQVCEVTVFDDYGRLDQTDKGYRVNGERPVYVKSNCLGHPIVESFDGDRWRPRKVTQAVQRIITENDAFLDFREFVGQRLRLRLGHGVSEEFLLIRTPEN